MIDIDIRDVDAVKEAKREFLFVCKLRFEERKIGNFIGFYHTHKKHYVITIDNSGRLSMDKNILDPNDPIWNLIDRKWINKFSNLRLENKFLDYLHGTT